MRDPQSKPSEQPGESVVLPVTKEQVHVGKQARETSRTIVRITPRLQTHTVDVPLVDEQIEVQRVPINRIVDEPVSTRQEGDVTIIPVFEEVLVVEKKLMLKEEVRITRRQTTRTDHREVALRTEEVQIERRDNP